MRHLLLVAALLAPAVAFAEDRATTKDAEAVVKGAVAMFKKDGKEKTLAAVNDPKGPFTFRDIYVTVYDLTGKCLAHGTKKERIGKNLINEKDADGKEFVKERMKIAKEKGSGWQDYKFQNPVTKAVEQKVMYFEAVDGTVFAAGAYKP